MSSIDELAHFVAEYQQRRMRNATDQVTAWLKMFDQADVIGDELVHVLRITFLSREKATTEIRSWLADPKAVSNGGIDTWDKATFLDIAAAGGSQTAVLDLLDEEAGRNGENSIRSRKGNVLYVYADDVSVHGMRAMNDITPWLKEQAPREFNLLILLERGLTGRKDYVIAQLTKRAQQVGKTARISWWCNQEYSTADCYSPSAIPDNADVAAWMEETAAKPTLRAGADTGTFFSSSESRKIIESEFLVAGARILRNNPNLKPRKYMRPLGNTIWPTFPLGVGIPTVTWRNCPNSAPLVLWAEGLANPLFPRRSN